MGVSPISSSIANRSCMQNEQQLIEGCKKGNGESQRALYDQYAKRMLVVAMRYSKGQTEAEDILQEAFIKVFQHIKKFRGDSSLATWIRKIVVNTALNHQRSKLYLFPMVDINELQKPPTEEDTLSDYHFKELLKMIQVLPTGCQIIFNLYVLEGYQHKEIAEMLDISEGTSKSQYARAKALLREMISKSEKVSYGRV